MKKNFIIPCVLILLLSCQKETVMKGESGNGYQLQNSNVVATSTNSMSSCYSDFLTNNYEALRQSNNIPITNIANAYWTTSIESNYETLNNCGTVIFANDRNIRDLEAVAPPSGPTPTAIYTDPTDVLNFLRASYYFGNSSVNYLDILVDAFNYANNAGVQFYNYEQKMMAIAKGVYELGYGNIWVSQAYHGDPDPLPAYVYHGIEILAGKYAMTSDFYNSFIAENPSEYISYPIVKYHKGIKLMADDDYIPSESTGPFFEVSANIVISSNITMMYFVTDLSTLIGDPNTPSLAPNQTSVYYQASSQEFFVNSNMTNFIPNGYYYLPDNHGDVFQKNNYMIEIENGKIKAVLGI